MINKEFALVLREEIDRLTKEPWSTPSGQPQPAINEAMLAELKRQLTLAESELT